MPACLCTTLDTLASRHGNDSFPLSMVWLSLTLRSGTGTRIAGGTNRYFGSDNDSRALKGFVFPHLRSPHVVSTKLHVSLGHCSSTRSNNRGLCILSFARLPYQARPGHKIFRLT